MHKWKPFDITLSCNGSSGPGTRWHAFIGFRPTKDGFSIWAEGTNSGDTQYKERIKHVKRQRLTWRNACKALLGLESGLIYGDFRGFVNVIGADKIESEILAACWMVEDTIGYDLKDFLLGLNDEDLKWLERAVGGKLFSNESVNLLSDYILYDNLSPKFRWEELQIPGRPNFDILLEYIESIDNKRNEIRLRERERIFKPHSVKITEVFEANKFDVIKPTSGITAIGSVSGRQQNSKLFHAIENFVIENSRVPTQQETQSIKNHIK